MENITKLENEIWWKKQYLDLSLTAIKNYQLSKDIKFYEYFKYFGNEAKECNKRIARLS